MVIDCIHCLDFPIKLHFTYCIKSKLIYPLVFLTYQVGNRYLGRDIACIILISTKNSRVSFTFPSAMAHDRGAPKSPRKIISGQ